MEIISYKFLVLLVQRQEEEKKEKERKVKEQQRLVNTQARGQAKKKVIRFDFSFLSFFAPRAYILYILKALLLRSYRNLQYFLLQHPLQLLNGHPTKCLLWPLVA